MRTLDNGKRYVNLKITEMRQPDDRGNTHTVLVDTWKPDRPEAVLPATHRATKAPPVNAGPSETELCTEAVGFLQGPRCSTATRYRFRRSGEKYGTVMNQETGKNAIPVKFMMDGTIGRKQGLPIGP